MTETEFIGMLVLALISLLTLFKLIVQPLIKALTDLTKTMTKLDDSVQGLKDDLTETKNKIKENEGHSRDAHQRLWNHNDKQDKLIEDHEKRIYFLENSERKAPEV